jgi:hypothetical protein
MTTKYNRMTRQDAEAAGYTVDRTCYPWFGYIGPRFNPTKSLEVYTDLESEMMRRQKPEERDFDGLPVTYDELLLAELRADVMRIRMMLVKKDTDNAWAFYRSLAAKIRGAVDHYFILHGYLCQGIKYDTTPASLDNSESASDQIVYQRPFGKSGGTQFFAEARLVVTADAVEVITRVCQEKQTVAYDQKSSSQAVCGKDTDTLLALVRAGLSASLEQVAHVAYLENIPTVFGLPV